MSSEKNTIALESELDAASLLSSTAPVVESDTNESTSDGTHLLSEEQSQEQSSIPRRCVPSKLNLVGSLGFLAFAGMVACSVCAAKVVSGELSVLPAGYGLLVASAVLFAVMMMATTAASVKLSVARLDLDKQVSTSGFSLVSGTEESAKDTPQANTETAEPIH